VRGKHGGDEDQRVVRAFTEHRLLEDDAERDENEKVEGGGLASKTFTGKPHDEEQREVVRERQQDL
jgi:hypothetical protein